MLERPVICTDVGDIRSVVTHDKNGIIIQPGKVQSLKDAIIHILHGSTYSRFVRSTRDRKVELLAGQNDYQKLDQLLERLF